MPFPAASAADAENIQPAADAAGSGAKLVAEVDLKFWAAAAPAGAVEPAALLPAAEVALIVSVAEFASGPAAEALAAVAAAAFGLVAAERVVAVAAAFGFVAGARVVAVAASRLASAYPHDPGAHSPG